MDASNYVCPIHDPKANSVARFGGKGAALAKLANAGHQIPPGFLISTRAYQDYVRECDLTDRILADAEHAKQESSELPAASRRISRLFLVNPLPKQIESAVIEQYETFDANDTAVAVRSSATVEDSPNFSFAGQHESFLNVRGGERLLECIRQCWASLWNAQAIAYRAKMGVDQTSVSMGVVVQTMVAAQTSGILFTTNPLSGDRSELVINSSFGLGESIVGGQITPDTYLLPRDGNTSPQVKIGDKTSMNVCDPEQGVITRPVELERRGQPSLTNDNVKALVEMGCDIEKLLGGVPQDIEWAIADGVVWVLQSRPITHLPDPTPDLPWDPPTPETVLIRRQVVENMPGPLSPLFEDLYLSIGMEESVDEFMNKYGFGVDIGVFVERPFFVTVNGYAYARGSYRGSWKLVWQLPRVVWGYCRVMSKLIGRIETQWRDEALPAYLKTIDKWRNVEKHSESNEGLLQGIRDLATADAIYWFSVSIVLGAAKVTDGMLHRFLQSRFVPCALTSGMFLRGFPSKTMEARTELSKIASQIRQNDNTKQLVCETTAKELENALRTHSPATDIVTKIDNYLIRFGQQVYDLDFAEPTLHENPVAIFSTLRALVQRPVDNVADELEQTRQEQEGLIEKTANSLGWFRRRLFLMLLRWAKVGAPCREDAMFYVGAAWGTLRSLARTLGQRLVDVGLLESPADVFYLTYAELSACIPANSEQSVRADFRSLIQQRRELRELRKRLHPPRIVPEGSRWKVGPFDMTAWETQKDNSANTDTLSGFAVSPGQISGIATVIMSPDEFEQMQPGTILVCPTTTPAWTPLFSQATGLVTDIGGILAHGSIVAREYNIPAVLGTGNATQRIRSGQLLRVDGNAGTVSLQAANI